VLLDFKMPQPNKRKKQLASMCYVEEAAEYIEVFEGKSGEFKRRFIANRWKKRTPKAEAASNTALPDVATPLPTPIAAAEAPTITDSPTVVSSLPPTDIDVVNDDNANNSVTDTQSNNHLRATDPSTSTSTQGIKLEPVVKTETTSTQEIKLEPDVKTETAPAPGNPSTDHAEAPLPTEPVINGPHLNRTVTVCRKAAKRTDPLFLAPSPQKITVPLPPQAENITVTQEPRVEEPLSTTTDEAASNVAAPDISECSPSPATLPPCTATVNVSTRCRSRHQIQRQLIERSETKPNDTDDGDDDDDYIDVDGDLSGPAPPPTATVNALTRRRSTKPKARNNKRRCRNCWRPYALAEYKKYHQGAMNVPEPFCTNTDDKHPDYDPNATKMPRWETWAMDPIGEASEPTKPKARNNTQEPLSLEESEPADVALQEQGVEERVRDAVQD
jgi:hypothetical protein